MKIIVPIKRVLDPYVQVQVKLDGSGVDLNGAKMSINPFCEIAVEQAIRLREQGLASQVIVVSVGGDKCQEQLRSALAMGADSAIHVNAPDTLESLAIAKTLVAVVKQHNPHMLIFGKQTIDGGNNQTGQMVATLLGWSQSTFVSSITPNDGYLTTTREVDEGIETIHIKVPCVLTCDLRLNTPRFTGLPQMMQAKKKPLDVIAIADFGIDTTPRTEILSVNEPKQRSVGIRVDSVSDLIDKLKNEAKVL